MAPGGWMWGTQAAGAACGPAPARQPGAIQRRADRLAVGRGAAADREEPGPGLRVTAAPGAAPWRRRGRTGAGDQGARLPAPAGWDRNLLLGVAAILLVMLLGVRSARTVWPVWWRTARRFAPSRSESPWASRSNSSESRSITSASNRSTAGRPATARHMSSAWWPRSGPAGPGAAGGAWRATCPWPARPMPRGRARRRPSPHRSARDAQHVGGDRVQLDAGVLQGLLDTLALRGVRLDQPQGWGESASSPALARGPEQKESTRSPPNGSDVARRRGTPPSTRGRPSA
jgi:hypothetical protein